MASGSFDFQRILCSATGKRKRKIGKCMALQIGRGLTNGGTVKDWNSLERKYKLDPRMDRH
jgi:hypothetical protein